VEETCRDLAIVRRLGLGIAGALFQLDGLLPQTEIAGVLRQRLPASVRAASSSPCSRKISTPAANKSGRSPLRALHCAHCGDRPDLLAGRGGNFA